MRIKSVEEIEMASDRLKYTLIVIGGTKEEVDLFLGLRVGSEMVGISIDWEMGCGCVEECNLCEPGTS